MMPDDGQSGMDAGLAARLERLINKFVISEGDHCFGSDTTAATVNHARRKAALTPALLEIQGFHRYLPDSALRWLSDALMVSPAHIESLVSFHPQFRRRPAGRHSIKVCIGTACHVKGASRIFDAFKSQLAIQDDNDTDSDGIFTIEKVACLGCCMLAPAVQIDRIIYGHLTPASVPGILDDFMASQTTSAAVEVNPHPAPLGTIRSCVCSSCAAAGSEELLASIRHAVAVRQLPAEVRNVGCTGRSYAAPLVEVDLADGRSRAYENVKTDDIDTILRSCFPAATAGGRIKETALRLLETLYDDSLHCESANGQGQHSGNGRSATAWARLTEPRPGLWSLDCGEQCHIATEYRGLLDPLDLEAYRDRGGFAGIGLLLRDGSAEGVVQTLRASGLRGRGGAGFPTWRKWQSVITAATAGAVGRPLVVCNGDEGDPGAFMDRMLLESFPYRVIEGIVVAAWTVGAAEAFLYIRREYPLALERIQQAIARCTMAGIIGPDCFGPGTSLQILPVSGAGAFVCGEETALIAALEGERGIPRRRPPYPSERGLWDQPTLINNVETLAMVPWIIRNGAEAFRSHGTLRSPGTKTFALAGKIRHGGLVEVPMGMTLRRIVEEVGGGIPGGRRLKGIQIGGPSGGCIPAHLADVPVDYEELQVLGAMMGSGGLVVLDEDDCMVDIARYFMTFTQRESCGKCVHCRTGTKRMLEILERLCAGQAVPADIDRLEQLGRIISENSFCGLGRTAANPVLSTIRHFRAEYEAHLGGYCPAGVCLPLICYSIDHACIGCGKCRAVCPADAIAGTPYRRHVIDRTACVKCGQCRLVCPSGAVRIEQEQQHG
jgi:NADH-quinone oxidoreductase subunit F